MTLIETEFKRISNQIVIDKRECEKLRQNKLDFIHESC